MKNKRLFWSCCILFFVHLNSYAQLTEGRIVYERKTNLYKKFKDDNVKDWIKELDKIKVDSLELFFNDSISLYQPIESGLKESYYWATSKNVIYQNFNTLERFSIKKIWGEEVQIADSVQTRKWKITDSKRTICGYNCRKAVWQPNDSTRIYAWYSDEIIPSVGPETFIGLPGAILGLAAEDGSVIYFAKSVAPFNLQPTTLTPKKGKGKIYTSTELKVKLEKEFGKEKWGKAMIKNVFGYW